MPSSSSSSIITHQQQKSRIISFYNYQNHRFFSVKQQQQPKQQQPKLKVWQFRASAVIEPTTTSQKEQEKNRHTTTKFKTSREEEKKSYEKKHHWKLPNGAKSYISTGSEKWTLIKDSTTTNPTTTKPKTTKPTTTKIVEDTRRLFHENILSHFLPAKFPHSVSPSYTTFASFAFIASVSGSAAMVLSTQTLLIAVGVGSSAAAPMAGAMNWVMKDGIGQLGGVLFASRLGSFRGIDADPKRWRMVSALCMDGASLLEIISPLFPGYFLPIASVANIGKNVGWLTSSASRAALHQSLATSGNLGDVTAKSGSQNIAAGLCGTALGIGLSPLVGGDFWNIVAGFMVLSAIHQGCTFLSLKAVWLKSLNRHRLNIIFQTYFNTLPSPHTQTQHTNNNNNNNNRGEEEEGGGGKINNRSIQDNGEFDFTDMSTLPPPSYVSRLETFIPFCAPDDSQSWLTIGCSIPKLCPGGANQLLQLPLQQQQQQSERKNDPMERYILTCELKQEQDQEQQQKQSSSSSSNITNNYRIRLTYLENANGHDLIKGMFHAHLIRAYFMGIIPSLKNINLVEEKDSLEYDIVIQSYSLVEIHFDSILMILNQLDWKITTEFVRIESLSAYRLSIEQ